MIKVLLDVNVVLDVLTDRKPHAEQSSIVWELAELGVVKGLLAAHGVTTIHYLMGKELGAARANRAIKTLLSAFGVAAVDASVLNQALSFSMTDFADAVTAAAAKSAGCEYIVTRNPKDFRASPVKILAPEAAVALLPTHL